MRLSKRIAIRLAYLQHQRTSNGPVEIGRPAGDRAAIGELDYWELILTDSVRQTYYDMAKEAIKMMEEESS